MVPNKDRIEDLELVLARLEEVIIEFDKNENPSIHGIMRDSLIKRFEMSIDVFWKSVKDFLADHHGLVVNGPKNVFKEAFAQQFFDKKNATLAEDMVDDRNETTHRYDRVMAEEIAQRVHLYHALMSQGLKQLKKV